MSSYEDRLRARFGGKIPDYLMAALGLRKRAEQRRADEAQAAEAAKEAEFERKRSLRRPPARVWLEPVGSIGAEVHWEPPETADELPPTGYIVTGDSDSTKLLPPEQRWQGLRLWRPGNVICVMTDYSGHQITKLGEHYQFSRQAEPVRRPVESEPSDLPEVEPLLETADIQPPPPPPEPEPENPTKGDAASGSPEPPAPETDTAPPVSPPTIDRDTRRRKRRPKRQRKRARRKNRRN